MKSETITIRKYTDNDLDAVLRLIARSEATNRTRQTWTGNDMSAMLAFAGEELIGIIPFERKRIVLGKNEEISALWVSAAHVEQEYRSQGIGTRLDQAIKDVFYPEYEAVFVIREDPKSAAYRWYQKLGYQHLANILSLKWEVLSPGDKMEFTLLDTPEQMFQYGKKLKTCFEENIGICGGYPKRDERFWGKKPETHYYRDFYSYSIIAIEDKTNSRILAYALLGRTDLRDDVDRLDILEFIVPQEEKIKNHFIRAVAAYTRKIGCRELRVQLAEQDSFTEWFKDCGFVLRWQTNLLGKYIATDKKFEGINWKFFHVDYI